MDGQLYGVQYNMTDIDAGLAAVRAVWTQALSDGTLSESSGQELLSALSAGDCAVLRYHGAIPLSVVAGWMGGSWKDDGERTVETLVYAAGAERLFARASDGALYSAPARVDSSTMASAQQAFRGLPCKFSGDAYAVYPETLLFEGETLTLPLLEERAIDLFAAQSGAGLEGLLAAFGFTAYTDFYSETNEQARVFVDNASTLRVNASGLLQYASAGTDSTVHAYEAGEVSGQSALDAQLDCARQILDEALRAGETNTHASLYAVQQSGEQTTLVFMQLYGGVPILGESDFATFRFTDGALSSATIRLQRFTPQEARRTVLPARQAAAGASGTERSMMVAYREQEDGYVPARFYLTNEG